MKLSSTYETFLKVPQQHIFNEINKFFWKIWNGH
jgi:hypothetical protein